MNYLKIQTLLCLSFLYLLSCQKGDFVSSKDYEFSQNVNDIELISISSEMKRGKKGGCTEYNFTFSCTGDVFTGSGSFTTCIDVFKNIDRIIGTQLNTTWECLTDDTSTMSRSANGNCGGFVELYFRPDRYKYRVVLSGGDWTDSCAPGPGESTSLNFSFMEIGPDGRHSKDCVTSNPVNIGNHTITISNTGPAS